MKLSPEFNYRIHNKFILNNNLQTGAPDIGYSDGLGLWYYAITGTDDFYTRPDGHLEHVPTTAGPGAPTLSYTSFSKGGPVMAAVADSTEHNSISQ